MGEVAETLDRAVRALDDGRAVGERALRLVRSAEAPIEVGTNAKPSDSSDIRDSAIEALTLDDSLPVAIVSAAMHVAAKVRKDPFWGATMRSHGGILEEPLVAPYYRSSN